jgi:hypothetical protein
MSLPPNQPFGAVLSYLGGNPMLTTLAIILIVLGVILLILAAFGITTGLTPYGMHGGITLIVIGVVLYVVVLLLTGHAVSY